MFEYLRKRIDDISIEIRLSHSIILQFWYNHPAVQFILSFLNFIPPKVFDVINSLVLLNFVTQGILYFSLLMALNRLAVFVESPMSPAFSK